jgi:hypothetical protein
MIKDRTAKKFLNIKVIENTQGEDPAQDVTNRESIQTEEEVL